MRPRTVHRFAPFVGVAVSLAVLVTMCAAGATAETDHDVGHRYARAFSHQAGNRGVVWDERHCTFTETALGARGIDTTATQVTVLPLARVTMTVRTRAARVGTVEVLFRCESPGQRCIATQRRYGSAVVQADSVGEHTMTLAGSVGDVPRVTAELEQLRAACVSGRDAGE